LTTHTVSVFIALALEVFNIKAMLYCTVSNYTQNWNPPW